MSSANPAHTQRKLVNLRILHYRYPLPKAIETTMGPMTCRPAVAVLSVEPEIASASDYQVSDSSVVIGR